MLDRAGMREKTKDEDDGNSRNGYHKVKCHVPETEELERERREEKDINKAEQLLNEPDEP